MELNQTLINLERLFNNPSFIALSSAILGSLVGSVTGYIFNTLLEKRRTSERYAIQRKNTIYSPIYKELLALHSYLVDILNSYKPIINIQFKDTYQSHNTFNFYIWNSIKKDVRYDYIPDELKVSLDKMVQQIIKHMEYQKQMDEDFNKITLQFVQKYKKSFNEEKMNGFYPNLWLHSIDRTLFPPYHNENPIRESLINYIKEEKINDIDKLSVELEHMLKNSIHYKNLRPELNNLISDVYHVINSFRSLINEIISSYEGGVKIQKNNKIWGWIKNKFQK